MIGCSRFLGVIVGSLGGGRRLRFFGFSFETINLFLRLFNVLPCVSIVQLDKSDEDVPLESSFLGLSSIDPSSP